MWRSYSYCDGFVFIRWSQRMSKCFLCGCHVKIVPSPPPQLERYYYYLAGGISKTFSPTHTHPTINLATTHTHTHKLFTWMTSSKFEQWGDAWNSLVNHITTTNVFIYFQLPTSVSSCKTQFTSFLCTHIFVCDVRARARACARVCDCVLLFNRLFNICKLHFN